MTEEISPLFVDFSKNVFILGKKYYERNQAKNELLENLIRIKHASRNKKHQHVIEELEKIEIKISELVDKEKKLADTGIYTNEEVAEISRQLSTLQSELSRERTLKDSLISRLNQTEQQLNREAKSRQHLIRDIEFKDVLLGQKKSEIDEIRQMVASFRERLNKRNA